MIGIIDYGSGNLASVQNALTNLGHDAALCNNPKSLQEVDRVILPGVGSFRASMERLDAGGWVPHIQELVATGKPFLGICLGMQLLFGQSEEDGFSSGLALIPGTVRKLSPQNSLSVPHVGWNNLSTIGPHPLLDGIKKHVDFYFVHSYCCIPSDQSVTMATCDYGGEFVAMAVQDNVAGVQFHPEKSQPSGLRLLDNFSQWSL